MRKSIKKWMTVCLSGILGVSAMAQQQEVVFKGSTGSSKYDGYKVTLYRYDLIDEQIKVEAEIKNGQFEIRAPYTGPGKYQFQNGYELAMKGGYAPYMVLVDKPGVVQIAANMESLASSTTKGSPAQAVVEAHDKMVEERRKPFMDSLKKKYGTGMVENPEKHMDDPRIEEMGKEWMDFEKDKVPAFQKEALYAVAKTHKASMAIPYLAKGSDYDVADQEKIYAMMTAENKQSRYGKELANTIEITKKSTLGTKIADFSLPTMEGKQVSLKEMLKGKKYLYIDFWASWCGPCRGEFPGMKVVYEKYKDKGFEIWGISTDKSRESWLNALKQESLTWPQVWEGGTPNEQRASGNLFYVPYLPSTYLLDADGKILARDLRGKELEDKLKELLD